MRPQVQSTLGIEVMTDPGVHTLTKAVIEMAKSKDPVDAIHDLDLALRVIKAEWADMQGCAIGV